MHVQNGELVGAAVIAIRRVRGHLFVAKGNVLDSDLVARIDQGVVCVSALSEDFGNALLLQTLCDKRRSIHVILPLLTAAPYLFRFRATALSRRAGIT
jgi:hypothetical protein